MKKIFAKLSAALFALFLIAFILPASAGSVLQQSWFENLNATKRVVIDATGTSLTFMSYKAVNASAGVAFIHFYAGDAVNFIDCATVTQGTTVPSWIEVLPANSQTYVTFPQPVTSANALCIISTTAYKGITGSANGVAIQFFTN